MRTSDSSHDTSDEYGGDEASGGPTRRRVLQTTGAGLFASSVLGTTVGAAPAPTEDFVETANGDFVLGGEPFYPTGGNQPQLRRQSEKKQTAMLDQWMAETDGNFTALRPTAFGSGTDRPTLPLQPEPEVYNEEGFKALDRLITLCKERGIRLILPLTNYYDWQGGMPQYVAWSDTASEKEDFYTDEQCQQWYRNYIRYVLNRTNTVTGNKYKNEPTIMMWELANEPNGGQDFLDWIDRTASLIQSIDSNHLVSTGTDLYLDQDTFRKAHALESIDACSLHEWADPGHADIGPDGGIRSIRASTAIAEDLGKPIYVGEFNWPVNRDESEDDIEDVIEINKRNRAIEALCQAMREQEVDGALLWDLRRRGDYPLSWNTYGTFPQDYRTGPILAEQYGSFGSKPSGPSVETPTPSLSVKKQASPDRKQLTVPRNSGEYGSKPMISLKPSGEEFTDPGGDDTTGLDDLSADIYLGYDADNLYMKAEVTDDTHFAKASQNYQQDSLQWAAAADGAYGPEYGLSAVPDAGSLEPALARYASGNAADSPDTVNATVDREGTTTTYDVTIPWTALFAESKGPGDVVPFSMLVNDNDSDDTSRDGVVGWTLPGINGKKTASALGLLVLESENGMPWQATSGDGPGVINAGTLGTWTASITNYAERRQTFEISIDGTEATKTIELDGGESAQITVERAFGMVASTDLSLTVENVSVEPIVDSALPNDLDGDGLYEDIDGDGDLDRWDAIELFRNFRDPAIQDHLDAYDFDEDGDLDRRDAVELRRSAKDKPEKDRGKGKPGKAKRGKGRPGKGKPGMDEPENETRTLSQPVAVLGKGTPKSTISDLEDPLGNELLSDPYSGTAKLAVSADTSNLIVNNYRPGNHPLPNGTADSTRLKRNDAEPTNVVYETSKPISAMELVWSQNAGSPGSITFYESIDGGSSWTEVSAVTEQYITAGPDSAPEKWQQKRSLLTGFSEDVTMVKYTIEGGKAFSVQPQDATLYTESQPVAVTGTKFLTDEYAGTSKLATSADTSNLVVNSYRPENHPLPDGSPDDTRLKRKEVTATNVVYAGEKPLSSVVLLWSQNNGQPGLITFEQSSDGGSSWTPLSMETTQYATAGPDGNPEKWRLNRTVAAGFEDGVTMVRYTIEGPQGFSVQPQRAELYTPDGSGGSGETGPELLRDPCADKTKLVPGSDSSNLVVNSYKPEFHPLPDGSADDTRFKRGSLEPTQMVYETGQAIGSMELIWSKEKFKKGTITFEQSTDGGETWNDVTVSTEQYATAGSEDYPKKWRQKRSTVSGFSDGATMVRYTIEGGATFSPQPQRAVVYGTN